MTTGMIQKVEKVQVSKMSNPYFRQVPDLEYVNRTPGSNDISNFIEVKNLFKRGKLRDDIIQNLTFFTKYEVIGDERPDTVANKVYDDPTLDWVVLLSNNITNIQSEWPMPQAALDETLLQKYGTYDKLHSGIHHYETKEVKNIKGNVILPSGLETPNTWRTNGNFIEAINTKITKISGTESKIATVSMNNGIKNLAVGDTCYDFVVGCSLFMRKDFFQNIGGFDNKFFMYFEDNDLCDQVYKNNKYIIEIPESKMIHMQGLSSNINFFDYTKLSLIHKISECIWYWWPKSYWITLPF